MKKRQLAAWCITSYIHWAALFRDHSRVFVFQFFRVLVFTTGSIVEATEQFSWFMKTVFYFKKHVPLVVGFTSTPGRLRSNMTLFRILTLNCIIHTLASKRSRLRLTKLVEINNKKCVLMLKPQRFWRFNMSIYFQHELLNTNIFVYLS